MRWVAVKRNVTERSVQTIEAQEDSSERKEKERKLTTRDNDPTTTRGMKEEKERKDEKIFSLPT